MGCEFKKIFYSFNYMKVNFSNSFENTPKNSALTGINFISALIMKHHHNLKIGNPHPKRGHKSSSNPPQQMLQPAP